MRGDIIAKTALENGFFIMKPNVMASVLKAVNGDIPKAQNDIEKSNGNVLYQETKNVAVISVDGAMYRKDMSAQCMSVVAYPNIIKAINKAENAPHIDTTLFRVSTPGGDVAGADAVEEAISSAKNKTVVVAEDTIASGGLWIFPAADEMYATEATMMGSIGVVATYRNPEAETNIIEQTSSNAPNKRCTLGEDCKTKMQTMLDGYESMFFARLKKNTGFDTEQIKSTFNSGGMIFANEAKEAGFIKGITTFDKLLADLTKGGVNHSSITASAQINKPTQGKSMVFNEESFKALEDKHAEAMQAMGKNNESLTAKVENLTAVHDTLAATHEALKAQIEAKESAMPEIMAMAYEQGVDKKTLVAMASVDSTDKAKVALFNSMGSNGAFGASGDGTGGTTKPKAWTRVKKMGAK